MGDIFSDIGNAFSSFVNEVEQFDPIGQAMNAVGGLLNGLGVPKELTDGLEIAAGALTGDLGLCAQGISGETSDLCKDLSKSPATTEQFASMASAVATEGYADTATSNVQVAGDTTVTDVDVDVQNSGGNTSVDVDTSTSTQADSASTGSGGSLQAMNLNSPDVMNFVPNDPIQAAWWSMVRSGYHIGQSDCTPEDQENFIRQLKSKLQNDPTFRADFEQQLGVKVCNNLPAGDDQIIVSKAAPSQINAPPSVNPSYGSPSSIPVPAPQWGAIGGGCGSGGDPGIAGIMNDPSLSLEDKVMMILEKCYDDMDKQVQGVAGQLANAQQNGAQAQAGGTSGSGGAGANGQSTQTLEMKLQTLMQQRTQMFDLMSNMSKTFNDAAMTAINNTKV